MESLAMYLTEAEARAVCAYREAYSAEYMRLYEPRHAGDHERLLFWSELAHRAGKSAQEKALLAQPVALPDAEIVADAA